MLRSLLLEVSKISNFGPNLEILHEKQFVLVHSIKLFTIVSAQASRVFLYTQVINDRYKLTTTLTVKQNRSVYRQELLHSCLLNSLRYREYNSSSSISIVLKNVVLPSDYHRILSNDIIGKNNHNNGTGVFLNMF